jgi:hypothetical protein
LTGTVLKRRCAVYTRKSTDEGLDMAFNSLDAQREACEAYGIRVRLRTEGLRDVVRELQGSPTLEQAA